LTPFSLVDTPMVLHAAIVTSPWTTPLPRHLSTA